MDQLVTTTEPEYTVLTINPGSTGTKIGLMRGHEMLLDLNVDTLPGEFDGCVTFADQAPLRKEKILQMLAENDVDLSQIDAVSGRGVGIFSCEGGTYLIDDLAYSHAFNDVAQIHHAATLGIVLARMIADDLDVPAYFVNPMCVDELCDVARVTGVKGIYRRSVGHPLNMKQVAIRHSELQGKNYADCNYIVAHLGGGISVGAHRKGRVIEQTRAGDGQAPIAPNRSGDLCAFDVMTLVHERGISVDDACDYALRNGGLQDLCGTQDLREIRERLIPAGDRMAQLAVDAMEYGIVRWVAMMAGVLKGQVDAILLTGGLAFDRELVSQLTEDLEWIAPVYAYPGSFETEALAQGAMRVLKGAEEVKRYAGKPVWDGFDFA